MAIDVQCPECGAAYSLRDDLEGKSVRCKTCEETFKVEAKSRNGGVARPRRRHEDDDEEDDRPRRRRRADDDEDEEDDRPRRGSGKKSASGGPNVLLIVGGVVAAVVLLACGGISLFVYRAKQAVDVVAGDGKQLEKEFDKALREAGFDVAVRPESLDQALQQLRAPKAIDRRAAADFIAKAPVDAARQAEVAKALEALLTDADSGPRHGAFFALKTWATKDNVPALAKALDAEKVDMGLGGSHEAAVATLARLKDERGAASLARFLPNFFAREKAVEALRDMGPVAQKAVLKYHNHKDHGCREKARELLKGYGARPDAITLQCVEDLRAADKDQRRLAAEWLASAPANEALRPQVAAALDSLLADTDAGIIEMACRALPVWAMPGNVLTLVRCLDDERFPRRRDVILVLGKLRDPRAALALAKCLEKGERREAADALIALGPSARDAVMPYLNHQDGGVRSEVTRILNGLGVKDNVSLIQALGDLKSPDAGRRREAARALGGMRADEARRAEVAAALNGVAADPIDRGAQELAVKALAVWGTRESVPVLVRLLDDPQASVRHAAITTLGASRDERAVKGLAARLLDRGDRETASRALQAMGPELGPAIEAEVRAGLTSTDKDLIRECIKVLGAVGTRASVAPLTQLALLAQRSRQNDLAQAAQAAIAAINARGR